MLRTLESRGFIEIDPEKGKYRTTPLGELEIKENEYIVYTHRNSDLTDFTAWEMNQLLGSGDKSSWMKLFCEHTGKLPPLDIKKEKIEKTNLDNPLRKIKPRVSLSQIKNKNNWEKGYDEGSPFYYKGEQFRKAGDLYGAIELYDKARFYGYNAPALYTAYAMAFRKLKDYENEIAVLEEGMMRDTSSGSNEKLAERKSRAVELRDQERKKGL